MENNTFERIKKIMYETFDGIEQENIDQNVELFSGGLELSSLETVIFYLAIEDEFNFEFPDEAYSEVSTLKDLVTYVEENTKK